MELPVRNVNGYAIVDVDGDLDNVEKAEQLKDTFNHLFHEEGEKKIVLNLDKTSVINSHGIGKMLLFHRRLKDAGGCLYITPPKGFVKELLKTLSLDAVLAVYDG